MALSGKPYAAHLTSAKDLVTQQAAYRAGFVSIALEKNRRATPFVDEARKLMALAKKAKSAVHLPDMPEIRKALLTAAGISDKAGNFLHPADEDEAIAGLVANYLEPAGAAFAEELVFRFLLTRGDALGGSMRNAVGALAQRKLTRSIISCHNLAGRKYWWTDKDRRVWIDGKSSSEDADIENKVCGLSWSNDRGSRTLIYNLKVPFVGKNVDLCLFKVPYSKYSKLTVEDEHAYVALGELKGGIDPAGADEHWKTARTALSRIHEGFKKSRPHTFFIGAAIEASMADEIWTWLQAGTINNAANLTVDDQLSSSVNWLCTI